MSNYSNNQLEIEAKNTTWAKVFSFVPEGTTVLDVGCSDGRLGVELKERKQCTVYGIEIDPGDFAAASKALDGVFDTNLETEAMPPALAKLRFDVIILADVIEHFSQPSQTLQKLKQLLRPEGRIVFSIPNMSHISVRMQLLSGRLIYTKTGLLDHTHLHFYDYHEVQRVLTNAGLVIKKIDANTLAYPPSFLAQKLTALGLKDAGYIAATQADRDAQSFQFTGYCLDAGDKKPKQIPLATTTPEHELTEYIEELKKANEYLNSHVAGLEARKEALEAQVAELHAKIEQSLTHRAGKKIKAIRKRLQAND